MLAHNRGGKALKGIPAHMSTSTIVLSGVLRDRERLSSAVSNDRRLVFVVNPIRSALDDEE